MTMTILGIDFGFGNFKLTGPAGSIVLPAMVAVNTGTHTVDVLGDSVKRPLEITVDGQGYFVGLGSHDWGEAVEDLSYERLLGSPVVRALFYGALAMYAKKYKHDFSSGDVQIYGGLPYGLAKVGDMRELAKEMKRWLTGVHAWSVGKKAFKVEIAHVEFISQAHAALSNFGFDKDGGIVVANFARVNGKRIGVISVGSKTTEMLAQENRQQIPNLTRGLTGSGVSDLLALIKGDGVESLGTWDARLHNGTIDKDRYGAAYTNWWPMLRGNIQTVWGDNWYAFSVVIAVGGGVKLAQKDLKRMFGQKLVVAEDPITAISDGLYKLGLVRSKAGK